jgi:electron transfer flavoprotein beta subunit
VSTASFRAARLAIHHSLFTTQSMHIVVLVKQVPDPEAAFSMLKVDEQLKAVIPPPGMPLVMSPFDEQAMEAALRVREASGDAKITVISAGPESARNVLKHALAMGADEALLINDPMLADAGAEVTAAVLATTIRSLGRIDLILTGRQAADWDAGIVGCGVGELLELPVVTFARKVEVSGRTARIERVLADGFETLQADLPVLVTVSNELGEARKPSLRETMRAARKPLAAKNTETLGIVADELAQLRGRRTRERLYVPQKDGVCELVAGADELEQAAALAVRLREARLI